MSSQGEAGPSSGVENPYLAHTRPAGVATGSNGAGASNGVQNPLKGLVPRRVSVEQAKNIMVSRLFPLLFETHADYRTARSTRSKD